MGRGGSARHVVASVALALTVLAAPAGAQDAPNPVAAENLLPGDAGWRLRRGAAPGELEGYASAASVQRGEAIAIHARASAARTLRWTVHRMGWYGGAEGRLVASGGPVAVGPRPAPPPDPVTGRVECDWPVTFTIATGEDWTSGVYLVKLVRDDGPETWVPFVVRDDARKGAALFVQPVTTWQAYNPWGGSSLYTAGGREASFERPYAEGRGAGQYFRYEHDFVRWAEARGLDLTYATSPDLERDPSLALGQRLFLSVGHDEYWSRGMRDALEAALEAGVNVAFFSANSVYWQVRLEPSRGGAPRRTVVCWKKDAPALDPLRGTRLETSRFRDPSPGDPEDALLGVMFATWQLADAPWIVRNAAAWPYEGTGLADGDALPLLVGYESDRLFDEGRTPPGTVALAASPVTSVDGRPDRHHAAVRTAPSGAFVFAAGTIQWSWGLSRAGVADERVRRITENVFARAGLLPAYPASSAPPIQRAGEPILVAPVEPGVIGGAAGEEGLRDGPALAARFRRPTSAALDRAGRLWVTDTGNHAIRTVEMEGEHLVRTVAGDGTPGAGDGPGGRLRLPQGIAIGPDGLAYVADGGNHRVVRLVPSDGGALAIETVAGLAGTAGAADGWRTDARFWDPAGLVFVGEDLFVADRGNGRIRRIDRAGTVTTVAGGAGSGFADGPGDAARFTFPSDLARWGSALAVLDAGNRGLRRLSLAPPYAVTTVAGGEAGFGDGPAEGAKLMPLAGIAVTGGAVLFADAGNGRIRELRDGRVSTRAGPARSGGAPPLAAPTGLVPLADGFLVIDQGSSTLRIVGPWTPPPEEPPPAEPPPGEPPPPASGSRATASGCASAPAATPAGLVALALLAARLRRAKGRAPALTRDR